MKKIVKYSLAIILISYIILLSRHLLIEEIFGFYLFPIVLVIIPASILYLLILLFKRIRYKGFISKFLLLACVLQILVISFIFLSVKSRDVSRTELISDIDYSIDMMEDVHPNLYSEISKEDFYSKADSIKSSLPEQISDIESYKVMAKLFATIKDGHTGVISVWNYFSKNISYAFRKTLPYKFEIENERIFVSKNYFYRNTIPIGSEIIKINGKPSSQCINEVSKLFSYENIPFRNYRLQDPMIWGLWNNFKDFEISYIAPNSKEVRNIKSSGGIVSKIIFMNNSKALGSNYNYKTISCNIGYLEFNAFKDLDKFEVFLDSTFNIVKENNVTDLIIDIRKNGGGHSDLAIELMQYISKTNFQIFDSGITKISQELINKKKLSWIDSTKRIIGTIYSSVDTTTTKLRKNSLRYKGRCYLLTSGNSFSSATALASMFQCYNVGKIIGTETGGLTVCYGDVYDFKLSKTKINMGVSCKKYFFACGVDDRRGVIPDYNIKNSFEDDRNNVDKVLEFTVDLINENNK